MVDPFEDSISEVKFRKQRVAMERRVSSTESAEIILNIALNCIHTQDVCAKTAKSCFTRRKTGRQTL